MKTVLLQQKGMWIFNKIVKFIPESACAHFGYCVYICHLVLYLQKILFCSFLHIKLGFNFVYI